MSHAESKVTQQDGVSPALCSGGLVLLPGQTHASVTDELWDALRMEACTTKTKAHRIVMLNKEDVSRAVKRAYRQENVKDRTQPETKKTIITPDGPSRAVVCNALLDSVFFFMEICKHMIIQRGDLKPLARDKPIDSIEHGDLRDEIFDMGCFAETITVRDGNSGYVIKDRYGLRRFA